MHFEEVDQEKLAASARRAREARHKGRPVRAHRESHPTAVRNLLLIVAFVALGVFTVIRILQYAH